MEILQPTVGYEHRLNIEELGVIKIIEPIKLAAMSRHELVELIRKIEHENNRYKKALEEIKDEEWHLAGEFTTIYMAAYSALYQDDDEQS